MLCMDGLTGADTGAGGAGDGNGAGVGAGAKVEGSEGALALALRDPKNVMVGSSGFQQLFLM